jgi:hypothetical protein
MKTLDNAWRWYQDARASLKRIHRIGAKHWLSFSGEAGGALRRDDHFRMLESQDITEPSGNALEELDDLAIVVMFSVFEGIVRDAILRQIRPEAARLRHQSLVEAAAEAAEAIRFGSFYRVLAPYRTGHAEIVEEVDQVREYRNWVAHGKRQMPRNQVTPVVAYDRLRHFLAVFVDPHISEEDWLALLRESGE